MKARIKGSIEISSMLLVVLLVLSNVIFRVFSRKVFNLFNKKNIQPMVDPPDNCSLRSYTFKDDSNNGQKVQIVFVKSLRLLVKDERWINMFMHASRKPHGKFSMAAGQFPLYKQLFTSKHCRVNWPAATENCPHSQLYVVRTLGGEDSEHSEEVRISEFLKRHQYEHIVKIFYVSEKPTILTLYGEQKKLWDIIEEYGGEDLQKFLDNTDNRTNLNDRGKADLVLQVAKGIKPLHDNHIYHLDIKPNNLVFDGNTIKLIDFNVSVMIADSDDHEIGKRVIPTFTQYRDPAFVQILPKSNQFIGYSREEIKKTLSAADMWSLAAITVYIYSGSELFPPFTNQIAWAVKLSQFKTLSGDQLGFLEHVPEGKPLEIVKECLQMNSTSRPNIDSFISAFNEHYATF